MPRRPVFPRRCLPLLAFSSCLLALTLAAPPAAAWRTCLEGDRVECIIINAPGIPDPVRKDLLDTWRLANHLLCTSTSPEDVRVGMRTEAGCEGIGTADLEDLGLP